MASACSAGTGKHNLKSGATVTDTSAYLAYDGSSPGTVTVTGTGSSWINSGSLSVGYLAKGKLTIDDSASVSAGAASIGYGGTGEVDVQNGVSLSSVNGTLGTNSSSSGTVIVTSACSSWTLTG